MCNVFLRHMISWLPTCDRNDISFLPCITKRKGSADLRHDGRSSQPEIVLDDRSGSASSYGARLQAYATCPYRDLTLPFPLSRRKQTCPCSVRNEGPRRRGNLD